MKKLIIISLMAISSISAYANPKAKNELAKKIVASGEISPYATPELKKLLQKAHQINDRIGNEQYGETCEFYEHFYTGHGNGDMGGIRNWRSKTLKNGSLQVLFDTHSGTSLVEFDIVAKGKGYAVDDVRLGDSANPKQKKSSIRRTAQNMVKLNNCDF